MSLIHLPTEILLNVCGFTGGVGLINLSYTHPRFYSIIQRHETLLFQRQTEEIWTMNASIPAIAQRPRGTLSVKQEILWWRRLACIERLVEISGTESSQLAMGLCILYAFTDFLARLEVDSHNGRIEDVRKRGGCFILNRLNYGEHAAVHAALNLCCCYGLSALPTYHQAVALRRGPPPYCAPHSNALYQFQMLNFLTIFDMLNVLFEKCGVIFLFRDETFKHLMDSFPDALPLISLLWDAARGSRTFVRKPTRDGLLLNGQAGQPNDVQSVPEIQKASRLLAV